MPRAKNYKKAQYHRPIGVLLSKNPINTTEIRNKKLPKHRVLPKISPPKQIISIRPFQYRFDHTIPWPLGAAFSIRIHHSDRSQPKQHNPPTEITIAHHLPFPKKRHILSKTTRVLRNEQWRTNDPIRTFYRPFHLFLTHTFHSVQTRISHNTVASFLKVTFSLTQRNPFGKFCHTQIFRRTASKPSLKNETEPLPSLYATIPIHERP